MTDEFRARLREEIATPLHDRNMRWLVTAVASTIKRLHHNELAFGSKPRARYPLWDPEVERAERNRVMVTRRAAAHAAIARRDAARAADRPAAARATPVVTAAPAPRLSLADRALVATIAVFVGWAAGQLVLGWATVSGRPGYAALLAYGGPGAKNAVRGTSHG